MKWWSIIIIMWRWTADRSCLMRTVVWRCFTVKYCTIFMCELDICEWRVFVWCTVHSRQRVWTRHTCICEWRVFVWCTVHSRQHIKLIANKSSCLFVSCLSTLTWLSSAVFTCWTSCSCLVCLAQIFFLAASHKSWLVCMVCIRQYYDSQWLLEVHLEALWQPWWSPMAGACCCCRDP